MYLPCMILIHDNFEGKNDENYCFTLTLCMFVCVYLIIQKLYIYNLKYRVQSVQ